MALYYHKKNKVVVEFVGLDGHGGGWVIIVLCVTTIFYYRRI